MKLNVKIDISGDIVGTMSGVFESIEVLPSPSSIPVPEPVPTPQPTPLPEPTPVPAPLPPGPSPFHDRRPSTDSIVLYVSSSQGNDSNDGLSPSKPLKTQGAAYARLRNGRPDWVLFKSGDVWSGGLGDWKKSGRSPTEPMVLTRYGSGPRPLFNTGSSAGLSASSSSGSKLSNVVFEGVHLYAHTRNPSATNFSTSGSSAGILMLHGLDNVVFEDIRIDHYLVGMTLQDFYGDGISNVMLDKMLVVDCYSANQGHSQGLYAENVIGLTIRNSIFDHNGWNSAVPAAIPTIFNHNLYIQTNCRNVVLDGVISARASSHGVHLRPGGVVRNSLFYRNPIGIQFGYTDTADNPNGVDGVVEDNAVLEGTDITQSLPRGWGIYPEDVNVRSGSIKRNIVANVASTQPVNFRSIMWLPTKIAYESNHVWSWPTSSDRAGRALNTVGPYVAPNKRLQEIGSFTSPDLLMQAVRERTITLDELLGFVRSNFSSG